MVGKYKVIGDVMGGGMHYRAYQCAGHVDAINRPRDDDEFTDENGYVYTPVTRSGHISEQELSFSIIDRAIPGLAGRGRRFFGQVIDDDHPEAKRAVETIRFLEKQLVDIADNLPKIEVDL